MKPVLSVFTCFSGTLASLASTTALDVGGTQLTVPSPAGFAVVPPEMTLLLNRLDSFVTPANQRLLWFLDDRELAKARAGLVPEAARSLSVQCAKKDIQTLFTKSDFAKLKKMIREQNAELIKKVEQQMPGYMDKVNKGIQKQFDWSGELGIDGYIPVAGQEETERSVSSHDREIQCEGTGWQTTIRHECGDGDFSSCEGENHLPLLQRWSERFAVGTNYLQGLGIGHRRCQSFGCSHSCQRICGFRKWIQLESRAVICNRYRCN